VSLGEEVLKAFTRSSIDIEQQVLMYFLKNKIKNKNVHAIFNMCRTAGVDVFFVDKK
jgi:hypothetical protein